MKTINKTLFYFTLLLFSGSFAVSCKSKKPQPETTVAANVFYSCSMHPQVMEKHPGNCPICGMKLTRMVMDKAAMSRLRFSDEEMKLANIRVDTIRYKAMDETFTLTGRVVADETQASVISAWIGGRIDKLYFKNEGDYIAKGAPLYDLYSEKLAAAEKDYLVALQQVQTLHDKTIDYSQLLDAAKQKLLLWGLTESQLDAMAKSGNVPLNTTIYSPGAGYVMQIPVKEGDYVMDGQMVYTMNALSSVWIEVQAFPGEWDRIRVGQKACATFDDLPGEKDSTTVSFISPEVLPQTKIDLVRAAIGNRNGKFLPGMQAELTLIVSTKRALILPSDAVLRDADGSTVWVQDADGSFENRMVMTGLQNSDEIEIFSGLKAGERVAFSGAYLIDSEFRLKKGSSPMAGMKM